ncbi:MAG: VOC family protein [Acidobacteria bacterium]|nr:VOC family protein [Acidobacteriota bacterium]
MAEQEMTKMGTFCWNELATKDLGAAKSFYTALLGWQLQESQAAGMAYNEIVAEGEHIGGVYQVTEEYGEAPSHWMAYVAVDDVDAKAKRVAELGGKVCVPPTDIPNVGRFCVITDPTGATLSLVKLSGAHE